MPYPRTEFPPELRTYACDGTHGLTHEREITFIDGDDRQVELHIEYCADETCAKIVKTVCQHASNSWHWDNPEHKDTSDDELESEAHSALLCDFCGKDGT